MVYSAASCTDAALYSESMSWIAAAMASGQRPGAERRRRDEAVPVADSVLFAEVCADSEHAHGAVWKLTRRRCAAGDDEVQAAGYSSYPSTGYSRQQQLGSIVKKNE